METIIKLKPEELNKTLFDYLRKIILKNNIRQITINLNDDKPVRELRIESKEEVQKRVEQSLKEMKSGNENFITFSAEDFSIYSQSLLKK